LLAPIMGAEDIPQTNASPSTQLMQLLWPGAVAVQAIHVAAKVGLADLVAAGPKTVVELSEATRMNGTSLARFLRALTSLGIFAEDRCELVAGDFFDGVPEGGDAYLLKGIIHDWNDEVAVEILRNCRRAIRPDGTLILLDTVLTGSDDPARALMDLLMMVVTGGRERTELELRSLLQRSELFSDQSNLYTRPLYPRKSACLRTLVISVVVWTELVWARSSGQQLEARVT
jgi:hypothetical protein